MPKDSSNAKGPYTTADAMFATISTLETSKLYGEGRASALFETNTVYGNDTDAERTRAGAAIALPAIAARTARVADDILAVCV
eukprot:m.209544 g.209544  ORF g.209544 m.209544 type:complete len:83 (-) comp25467_c0_seq1:291-539(-)